MDKSPWNSNAIVIFFLSLLGSLIKQGILFEIFLQFSLPPLYLKLKLGKNSGYKRQTLFVGRGEGFIGVRAGGATGAAAPPNFGQLRFFGQ